MLMVKSTCSFNFYRTRRSIEIGSIVLGSVMSLSNTSLFIGCVKRQRLFFIPWLVFKMVGIVICYIIVLILIGTGILVLVFGRKQSEHFKEENFFINVVGNHSEDEVKDEIPDLKNFKVIGDLAGASSIVVSALLLALNCEFIEIVFTF